MRSSQGLLQLVRAQGLYRPKSLRASHHSEVIAARARLDRGRVKIGLQPGSGIPLSIRFHRPPAHPYGPASLRDRPAPMDSHTFPFGAMAAEVFASLPRTGDHVFPATREF